MPIIRDSVLACELRVLIASYVLISVRLKMTMAGRPTPAVAAAVGLYLLRPPPLHQVDVRCAALMRNVHALTFVYELSHLENERRMLCLADFLLFLPSSSRGLQT